MKKVLGLAAAAVLGCSSLFAGGTELAGKFDIGYVPFGASYFDTDYGSGYGSVSGFELYPALVIVPEKSADLPFFISYEASLDMVFGKSDYYDGYKSTVITPGGSILFNYPIVPEEAKDGSFVSKLTPYAGLSLGIPIQKTTFSIETVEPVYEHSDVLNMDVPTGEYKTSSEDYSSTKIGLGMGFTAGVNYEINDKFVANFETGYNFLKFHEYFLRAGVTYRFQRKGSAVSSASSSDEGAKAKSESEEKKAEKAAEPTEKKAKVAKEVVEVGGADDPFVNTSWTGDLGTIVFGEGGKCKYMGKEGSYKLSKNGEAYTVSANCGGAKFSFTTEGKDASEGTMKTGTVKATFKRG